MGKRNTSRKLAMKALYQASFEQDIEPVINTFLLNSEYIPETKEWAISLARGAWEKQEELNNLIESYAIGWDLSRINPIDKSILQLAFYELLYTKTPAQVVINEAIEISKKYSTEDSPRFINGILGNYIKKK
jgi:transcription antitermination protein NusB